jgi:hypothetical protein
MKFPRSAVKIGIAAGLLGGASGVAIAAGLTPSLGTVQPISHEAPAARVAAVQQVSDDSFKAGDDSTAAPAAAPAAPASETKSFDAAGAGTVTYKVEGSTLTLVDATTAAGYTVKVDESAGREIEVVFSNATQRVKAKVEFEDGAARESVTTRAIDDKPAAARNHDDDVDDKAGDDDHHGDDDVNEEGEHANDDHGGRDRGRGSDDRGGDDHGGRGRGSDD